MSLAKGACVYTPDTVTDSTVALLKRAACPWVRLELTGPQDHGTVNYLTSHGFQVIALVPLTIVPGSTRDDWQAPITTKRFTDYVTRYAALCGVLAAAMPGVQVWELCNEEGSIGSQYRLSPQQYATLYYQAHIALRALTQAQVIVGGLFAWAPRRYGGDTYANSGAEFVRVLSWLEEIQQHPLVLDAVGVHLYLNPADALVVQVVHDYMADYAKVTDRPLYITEYGWQTKVCPQKAQNIVAMHQALAQHPQVMVACYFCVYHFPGSTWGLEAPGALAPEEPAFSAFTGL